MSARPEILFPLFGSLTSLAGVGPKTSSTFSQLHVHTPRDLLFTLPHSGISRMVVESVKDVPPPAVVTVQVTTVQHRPSPVKGRPTRVTVSDGRTDFELVFFHARGDWLRQTLPIGEKRLVSGKIELFDGVIQMVHPEHIVKSSAGATIPAFEPIYPLVAGLSQKLMQRATKGALEIAPALQEWIDPGLKTVRGWPGWQDALRTAHDPATPGDLSPQSPARQRLAYDELFAHQLTLAIAREARQKQAGIASVGTGDMRNKVLNKLPFRPTDAQTRVMGEIASDMASSHRMNRLLQGDVGSGKTLVAFVALVTAVESGGQGVMMAPTEILARQHLASLQPLAESAGIVLEIFSGRDKGRARQDKLKALAKGDIQILVGTHAVFQDDVHFADLRLVVVDEQHRFGVRQRMNLSAKAAAPDVLVMTATPIPRSLALARFGDMDFSQLNEKPPGRRPVTTALVSNSRLQDVIARLKEAIAKGQQAYWVCPLVSESESLALSAVQARQSVLAAAFGNDRVALVHGQMAAGDKDAAMARFLDGETSVLVATTAIEVGVDVPNATIMIIESAEHFGLTQLHQLRGRVGRGTAESTCLLMYAPPLGERARQRLEILRRTEDGFKIAEEDMRLRGAGDVLGVQQSGLPRFRIADLEHQTELMQVACDDARLTLQRDPELTSVRGTAIRAFLFLMEQDKAIRMISVG